MHVLLTKIYNIKIVAVTHLIMFDKVFMAFSLYTFHKMATTQGHTFCSNGYTSVSAILPMNGVRISQINSLNVFNSSK